MLQESEAEMINNIFTLDQKEAKDIMTHRKQIMALDGTGNSAGSAGRDPGHGDIPVIRYIWMMLIILSVSYILRIF